MIIEKGLINSFIMIFLSLATLVWSLSFSLIGYFVVDKINIYFSIFARLFFAFLIFSIFIFHKNQQLTTKNRFQFMGIGAVQIGAMYIFYYLSFYFLNTKEVLLFTVTTPIYITLISNWINKQKTSKHTFFCLALSMIGAIILRFDGKLSNFWIGFFILQMANLCFAMGQNLYVTTINSIKTEKNIHYEASAFLYLGAAIFSGLFFILKNDFSNLPHSSLQWFILIWLGAVASGIGYFLWNFGATKVEPLTVALMNNMIIPVGLIINLLFFPQTSMNWTKFIFGSILMMIAFFYHFYWIDYKLLDKKIKNR